MDNKIDEVIAFLDLVEHSIDRALDSMSHGDVGRAIDTLVGGIAAFQEHRNTLLLLKEKIELPKANT